MTQDQSTVRRRRHLMDPNAPRKPRDPEAERRLQRVQQWVLSTLAVTTILHLSGGLIVAAAVMGADERVGQIGLVVIAGAFGALAIAVGLAIHRRSMLSPWLALGAIPILVGLLVIR
ncbi:hypothetical protein [Nocardioides sp.]|uniref:hypothetical protein n=1 Tax=Nocardioides sp. TaxID=35761 RepID=UPI002ED65811